MPILFLGKWNSNCYLTTSSRCSALIPELEKTAGSRHRPLVRTT